MFKLIRNLAFTAIIAMVPYAQATVYSWLDDNGNTHFSDTPNENSEEVSVQIHSTGASMERDQTIKNNPEAQSDQQKESKGSPSNNNNEQPSEQLPLSNNNEQPSEQLPLSSNNEQPSEQLRLSNNEQAITTNE